MTVSGMTGFASQQVESEGWRVRLDLKSVNGKGLDIRTKVPAEMDGFDLKLKKLIGARLVRGSVSASLFIDARPATNSISIDELALQSLLNAVADIDLPKNVQPARLDGLLAVRGVVKEEGGTGQVDRNFLESLATSATNSALDELLASRLTEGAQIKSLFEEAAGELTQLVETARTAVGERAQSINERYDILYARLEDRIGDLDRDRIAQEVAAIAVKLDITEELDRLDGHIETMLHLLGEGGAIGRRLDFLCQELNREANTLCSKSQDHALTNIGLALKTMIDQIREQALNLE